MPEYFDKTPKDLSDSELTSAITDAVARGQLEMARNLRREKLYRAFIVALNTRITPISSWAARQR